MTAPIKSVRGTRDILPPASALWQHVEDSARRVFARYGFLEIRTPIFEATELFARGVGEETDIVSKEMFSWEDKARAQSEKSQSLTLRPENTAGVVRAYIEHQLERTGLLQKLYYIGPQFRRERPQKGRYRQFYQIGAEVLGPTTSGSESPVRDAEIITMLTELLAEVGIKGWQLQLNSVGSPDDRKNYREALRAALAPVAATMCADCQRRAVTNPLRVLDCKNEADQPIIEKLPKITAFLSAESKAHFAEVQKILTVVGITYQVNERMVRGLDYYSRTTFEFTHGSLGAQSALLGGGRYDGLSESLGGPRAPGIGFALGLDRFVMTLEDDSEFNLPASATITYGSPRVYIAPLSATLDPEAAKLAHELRAQGIACHLGDGSFNKMRKIFETAEKLNIQYVVIIGEDELKTGVLSVKDIITGEQRKIVRYALASSLDPK